MEKMITKRETLVLFTNSACQKSMIAPKIDFTNKIDLKGKMDMKNKVPMKCNV